MYIDTSKGTSVSFALKNEAGVEIIKRKKKKKKENRATFVVSPCDARRNNSLEVDDVSQPKREAAGPRSIIRR